MVVSQPIQNGLPESLRESDQFLSVLFRCPADIIVFDGITLGPACVEILGV